MGFTKKVPIIRAVDNCGIPLSLINLPTNAQIVPTITGNWWTESSESSKSVLYVCGISVGAESSFCFVYPKTITRRVVVSKHTTYSSKYICCHQIYQWYKLTEKSYFPVAVTNPFGKSFL